VGSPDRYRSQEVLAERAGVKTYEGLDTVDGLPVLIYEFEGEPAAGPGEFESENALAVRWTGSDQGKSRLIAALPAQWRPRGAEDGPLSPMEVLDAARALRDAAAAGTVHGDLRPERLLVSGKRLLIEGFGVPWRPREGQFRAPEVKGRATPPADVWSLAASIRELGTEFRDETVDAVLALCLSREPDERPSAEELYLALERLLPTSTAATAVDQGSSRAERETPASTASAATAAARTRPGKTEPPAPRERTEGAAGDLAERRRRLGMIGVLLASVVILALLAIYGPRGGGIPASASREATVYVVEVFTAPEGLPPVTIHLVSSPPGSSLARGDRLGTAPRHLALDRAGAWEFQGSLQDRRSEVVEIRVPEERSLTLVVPDEAAVPSR
jgi:hypothetical protein